jgi:hypothetical protein
MTTATLARTAPVGAAPAPPGQAPLVGRVITIALGFGVFAVRCGNRAKPSQIRKSPTLVGYNFTERAGHAHATHQAADFSSQEMRTGRAWREVVPIGSPPEIRIAGVCTRRLNTLEKLAPHRHSG